MRNYLGLSPLVMKQNLRYLIPPSYDIIFIFCGTILFCDIQVGHSNVQSSQISPRSVTVTSVRYNTSLLST